MPNEMEFGVVNTFLLDKSFVTNRSARLASNSINLTNFDAIAKRFCSTGPRG